MAFKRISKLNTPGLFQEHLHSIGVELPFNELVLASDESPLGNNWVTQRCGTIGNRFCILPMEGWDGTREGNPSELTTRRWENFGKSGAKLIWGGEAVAIRPDGRANPNQLMLNDLTLPQISGLRKSLVDSHLERFGSDGDLSVGLQLTHSGRFARPNDKHRLEPKTVYSHPVLDSKFSCDSSAIVTDDDLKYLIDDFVQAAMLAQKAGFDWVDIKHCHGYLGHELLSGYDRPGEFGGSFENRTRFLRDVTNGIRSQSPGLGMGVRLSVFDFIPFSPGETGTGIPFAIKDVYPFAWGGDGTGVGLNLEEPNKFIQLASSLGIELICTTAGSPYYCPHIQRPASFPPSDGYQPPEDPLIGVARQIDATHQLKLQHPNMFIVGSGYSYLQDWLPNVAQAAVASNMCDSVGLGRMVLSYPELPADVLSGRALKRKKVCRTFSDCTSAPRNGLVSGCFPLDSYYKNRPEYELLRTAKKQNRKN